MLVLLLVFMITTPLLYQGLDVDLPTTEANEVDISKFQEPLVVEVHIIFLQMYIRPEFLIKFYCTI